MPACMFVKQSEVRAENTSITCKFFAKNVI
jgi:hypothetical protein